MESSQDEDTVTFSSLQIIHVSTRRDAIRSDGKEIYESCNPTTRTTASIPTASVKKMRSHRMRIEAPPDRFGAASSLE